MKLNILMRYQHIILAKPQIVRQRCRGNLTQIAPDPPRIGDENGTTVILPTPKTVTPLNSEALTPGLAPGMNEPPRAPRHSRREKE
jgi:hypothetical protein